MIPRSKVLPGALWVLMCTVAVGSVDTGVPSTSAFRVTSTIKPLVFPLPSQSGRVVLAANATAVVDGRRPFGPWSVTIEEGEAALELPAGSPAGGSYVGGKSTRIVVQPESVACFYIRGAQGVEGGRVVSGSGKLRAVAKGAPEVDLPDNLGFQHSARAGLAWTMPETAALVRYLDKSQPGAVRFSSTIPPSVGGGTPDPSVQFRPLSLGTATVHLPDDGAVQTSEKLTSHRERLMITTKGQGLAGPGMFVDFMSSKPDRMRNLLVTGATGKVKFYMKPSWMVTLAPRTVLELDTAMSDAFKGQAPKMKLLRGAMMCEDQSQASGKTTAPPVFDGLSVTGQNNPVVGNKSVIFAAPQPESGDAAKALSGAMTDFHAATPDLTPAPVRSSPPVPAAPASPAAASPAPVASAPAASAPAASAPAASAPVGSASGAPSAFAAAPSGGPGASMPSGGLLGAAGGDFAMPADGGAGNLAVAMTLMKEQMKDSRARGDGAQAGKSLASAGLILKDMMDRQAATEEGLYGGFGAKMEMAASLAKNEQVGAGVNVLATAMAGSLARGDASRAVAQAATVTLMGELPATAKSIASLVPVQAALPGKEPSLEISMMARLAEGRPDVKAKALEAIEKDASGVEVPVALVVPKDLPEDAGPDPEELKVIVHPRKEPKSTKAKREQVVEQQKVWRDIDRGIDRKKEAAASASRYSLWQIVLGALVAGLLLFRGRYLAEVAQESVLGVVVKRCDQCDLILDSYPLGKVGALENHDHLFSILGYDDITEAARQNRTREQLLEWSRTLQAVNAKDQLHIRAHWCQRCVLGYFVCEVVGPNGVRDEAVSTFVNEDTRTMVLSVNRKEPAKGKGAA